MKIRMGIPVTKIEQLHVDGLALILSKRLAGDSMPKARSFTQFKLQPILDARLLASHNVELITLDPENSGKYFMEAITPFR
jgi:hypothetical protein